MIKYATPGIVILATIVVTIFVLPPKCSILSNEVGPFVNCLQDIPQLCCRDYNGVFYARIIFLVGIALSVGIGWYIWPKADKESVKIFD